MAVKGTLPQYLVDKAELELELLPTPADELPADDDPAAEDRAA